MGRRGRMMGVGLGLFDEGLGRTAWWGIIGYTIFFGGVLGGTLLDEK
jgi:hypothetical protein